MAASDAFEIEVLGKGGAVLRLQFMLAHLFNASVYIKRTRRNAAGHGRRYRRSRSPSHCSSDCRLKKQGLPCLIGLD